MAGRIALALFGVWFFTRPVLALSLATQREYARLRVQCDEQGVGKSCYHYGIARLNRRDFADRKIALRYLMRGCELKYKEACRAYDEASVRRVVHHHRKPGTPTTLCFQDSDLKTAELIPNNGVLRGQFIKTIHPDSLWTHAGFHEGDLILKINNVPISNAQDTAAAFKAGGRQLGIDVQRNDQIITLWYNCAG